MRRTPLPLALTVIPALALVACGKSDSDAAGPGTPPNDTGLFAGPAEEVRTKPPAGDPEKLPHVPADEGAVAKMLTDRFGPAVARNVRVEISDTGGGKRLLLSGEVPNEEIRQAVLKEVEARVDDIKTQDSTLELAGPIRQVFAFDVPRLDHASACAFSPDLSLLVTGVGDIYEVATGRRLNRMTLPDRAWDKAWCLAISPDSKLLATGFKGGALYLWDLPLGTFRKTVVDFGNVRESHTIAAVAFMPDGKRLAAVDAELGQVQVWDVETAKAKTVGAHVTREQSHRNGDTYHIAVSPDGKLIATGCFDERNAFVWDVERRAKVATLGGDDLHPEALAWSRSGKYLLAGRSTNNTGSRGVYVFDTATWKPTLLARDPDNNIDAVAISPDDKTVAVNYRGGGVVFWDLATGKEWQTLEMKKVTSGTAMTFSPDGAVLAMDCRSIRPMGVRLWDVSKRPGGRAGVRMPEPVKVDDIRDDRLADVLAHKVTGTFPRCYRNVKVTREKDGSFTLTGQCVSEHYKKEAEFEAAHHHLAEEPANNTPYKINNKLEVVPTPDGVFR